jgi:hypothetical protein
MEVPPPPHLGAVPIFVPSPPLPPPPPAQIRAYSARTNRSWEDIPISDNPDTEDLEERARQERRKRIRQAIGAVIGSEQLAALLGLGCSAGVNGPNMGDLWRLVRQNNPWLFKTMQGMVGDATSDSSTGDIEQLLTRCQILANTPVAADPAVTTFISSAEAVIAEACRAFLVPDNLSDHAHCLRILSRRSPEKPRTRLFTTNYDLCIETAAAQSGVLIVDGFGRESPPMFDGIHFDVDFVRRRAESKSPEYLDGVVHLVKLHGSVDWARSADGQVVRREKPEAPVLIYPRSDKFELSYRQPFLEMMSQFHIMLRQPHLGLLILGFGFSDAHLSETILGAIRKNLSLRVVIATLNCQRHCDKDGPIYKPTLGLLKKLADQGDSRVLLLDCGFSDFVRLIPNVGTETEEDRLRNVIRALVK